ATRQRDRERDQRGADRQHDEQPDRAAHSRRSAGIAQATISPPRTTQISHAAELPGSIARAGAAPAGAGLRAPPVNAPRPSAAPPGHIRTLARPTPNRVIAARTIQTRPLALVGAAAVAVEALIALLGGHVPLLAAVVLLVAPGLALLPLLPERSRRDLVTALA